MKLKHLQHIVLCLCGWWIGLTACQSAYEGEEEAETSSQSLHVTARAEGTSAHLTYPAYILAFNEQGDYVEVCQNAHLLFYAQSPDFHKLGLCYYLKILYL